MDLSIVDADRADVEKLVQIYSSPNLYHTVEEASWLVKCYFDYHHIKVAKFKDEIIGVLFWRINEEKHHGIVVIEEFWVDKNYRRKGIGERLLRTVIEDAKKLFESSGYVLRRVLTTTAEDNMPARKLYEKVGFEKSAELKDLFGKGETELIYILSLSP
jgi:ribosomal protein S18 acetylase RimI-like enzyme